MTITRDMIDKELRVGAFIGPLVMRPTEGRFRLLRFLQRASIGQNVRGLACDQIQIPRSSGKGTIRTRIYRPEQVDGPLPVLVYFHGGGYAIGVPESTGRAVQTDHRHACLCFGGAGLSKIAGRAVPRRIG